MARFRAMISFDGTNSKMQAKSFFSKSFKNFLALFLSSVLQYSTNSISSRLANSFNKLSALKYTPERAQLAFVVFTTMLAS